MRQSHLKNHILKFDGKQDLNGFGQDFEMGGRGGRDFAIGIDGPGTTGGDGEGSSLLRMDERKNMMTASIEIGKQSE